MPERGCGDVARESSGRKREVTFLRQVRIEPAKGHGEALWQRGPTRAR